MSKYCKWNDEWGTGGTLECKCDQCKKQIDFKFKKSPDYKGSQEKLKKQDWFSRKINEVWYDFCSKDCYDKFIAEHERTV